MPKLKKKNGDLFFGTGGVAWQDGRPLVVLVHGAGNDHSVWALQARTLAQHRWNVAALDLPGHGQSDDRGSSTIAESVEHVSEVIDELSVPDQALALVGHSMGACIALSLAAKLGEREGLKLVLIGAGAAMPVNDGLLDATLHRPLEAHRFITAFGYGRPSHFGGAEVPGVWNLGASFALLDRCPPSVLHRDFSACNQWRGKQDAALVSAQTLVLSGALDRMTPAKAGRALAEAIDGAEFEVLPGVGHMMMAEAPGAVNEALRRFLSLVD